MGLTLVEPLKPVEENVPGVTATLVAPLVDQLRVLLEPEFMPSGLAANELIIGADPVRLAGETAELQPTSKAQTKRKKTNTLRSSPKDLSSGELSRLLQEEAVDFIRITFQSSTLASNRRLSMTLPDRYQYT